MESIIHPCIFKTQLWSDPIVFFKLYIVSYHIQTPCVFKLYPVPYHPLCLLICVFSYASSSSLSHSPEQICSGLPSGTNMFFPFFATFEYSRGPWHHWMVLALRLDGKPQVLCTCPASLIYFYFHSGVHDLEIMPRQGQLFWLARGLDI